MSPENPASLSPGSALPRHTARLELGDPTAADIDTLVTFRGSPGATRWLLNAAWDADAYRREWLQEPDPSQGCYAVIRLDGVAIGTLGLTIAAAMAQPHGRLEAQEGKVSYILDPSHHGRGFATEALSAVLAVAFEHYGLHRVTAGCFADNIGSWKVMEKVGMRREQHGVKDSWHEELGWLDGYTYAILQEEWPGSRQ